MIYPWDCAVKCRIPLLEAIVPINRYKPIKRKFWLIFKAVEAHRTLILKPPVLSIVVKGHPDILVDTMNNLQVDIKGVRELVEEIWAVRYLFGSEYRTN